MDHARGEWVVTLDCDLQDRPEEIINLYAKAQEGFDIVLARRVNRQDDVIKRSGSYLFYRVLSYLTDTTQDPAIANFALYRRSVIEALASMHDYDRYYPTMIHWVGFRMAKLDTVHSIRKDDRKSSYTLHGRLSLAFDTIISFSDKPLRLTVKFGLLIAGIAAVSAMILVGQYFFGHTEASGWTSLFLSIWFLSGILIAIFGIVGVYVGRTFESVKKRPSYIVSEVLNGREG